MNDKQLLEEISNSYQNEDDENVIYLWKKFGGRKLNLKNAHDRELCDALSDSLSIKGFFDESLKYVNQRIIFMKSDIGRFDREHNNFVNLKFYTNIKTDILEKQGKTSKVYNTLNEYFKLGGTDEQLFKYFSHIRELFFEKYLYNYIQYSMIAIFIIIHLLKYLGIVLMSKTNWVLFLVISIILSLYIAFFKNNLKKVVFRIMS